MEAEEEDYFNNSDDEEAPKTNSTWSPLAPLGSVNHLKRKRGKGFTALPSGPPSKQLRSIAKSRSNQSLVDYDDDEETDSGDGASSSKIVEPAAMKLGFTPLSPPRQIDWFADTQGLNDSPLKSPLGATPKRTGMLLGDSPPADPSSRSDSPPRLGEKRRRTDEDDEDEMLERLVKNKKPSLEKDESKAPSPKSAAPGKMKLKLGATSFSMASGSGGLPPSTEMKDVDSG